MLHRIRQYYREPVPWPSLADEIGPYRALLKGKVLNAGAGDRDLSPLVDGELFNQDLPTGRHNGTVDFLSPLHQIPVADGFFDVVFCNAVLEHVSHPARVIQEFGRVLRPDGYLYLAVPFMQPEHHDPGDYQRYTKDGLVQLVSDHGFQVVVAEGVHNAYHTLAWIAHEWLTARRSASALLLRFVLIPVLKHRCRHSRVYVPTIASSYRVIARKRAS